MLLLSLFEFELFECWEFFELELELEFERSLAIRLAPLLNVLVSMRRMARAPTLNIDASVGIVERLEDGGKDYNNM